VLKKREKLSKVEKRVDIGDPLKSRSTFCRTVTIGKYECGQGYLSR